MITVHLLFLFFVSIVICWGRFMSIDEVRREENDYEKIFSISFKDKLEWVKIYREA